MYILMEKKQIILPSKKFFGSTDEDLNLKISLDETKNLLREGERTTILDTSVLFNKERNESTFYKIHGKLKMVFPKIIFLHASHIELCITNARDGI